MQLTIKLSHSVQTIGAESWRDLESPDFPFTDYAFLKALEESGSIGRAAGWEPVHLEAWDSDKVQAVLCGYVKTHSYGEYIFDWEWARFYQQYQQPYYPKFLQAIPFTPATGPRILIRPGADADGLRALLLQAALELAEQSGMSSMHALFIPLEEEETYTRQNFAIRHSLQYHWRNQAYRDFQDYLDSFVGKRRRDIQRERQRVQASGLTIECLRGSDLRDEHAQLMDQLYRSTSEKKQGHPYLRPGFFQRIFASMQDRILFVVAKQGERCIAGALNFYKGQSLFGRYWGCLEEFADLHFELCYYQTIDFALRERLQLFEAGAQGEHKIQRGFRPSLTLSAHRIFNPQFRPPIERFISEERGLMQEAMAELDRKSPFKNS